MLPPDVSSTVPPRQRAVPWGFIFFGYCAVVLIAQLMHQSAIKPLWRDEVFSWYEVQGKSWAEVFHSLKGGINLLPPAYFFVLWSALQFTEFTPLLGRALSGLFIAAAIPVLWLTLRRTTGRLIAAIAIAGVVFGSPLIFYHNSEARPYGLLFFAAALVARAFARSMEEAQTRPSTVGLIIIANALLPSVNYMGGFYGAAALAATVLLDLGSGRWRWQLYGSYLVGWILFALFFLPLCWVQYRTRGAEGGKWLPNFSEAAVMLGIQWVKTLLPFVVIALPFAVCLFWGRRLSIQKERSQPQGGLPVWPLALLGLAWLCIPFLSIVQSLLTHRNVFIDRYFIASDLGWVLFLAALASLACRHWRGSQRLEDALQTPRSRAIATLLVVSFVVIVSLRFYRNPRNVLWGRGDAVYACKAWPGPKATFSLSYFVEGYVRRGPEMQFIILSRGPSDRATIVAYARDFDVREMDELTAYSEFVYIDSSETPEGFNLEHWAGSHGYQVEQVGTYAESHGNKGIFQLRRRARTTEISTDARRVK